MNSALADGTLAKVTWRNTDSHLFSYTTYAFTIDGGVKVFDYYPGPSDFGDGPYVARETTCTGPFRVATFTCPYGSPGVTVETVVVDGCPY